MIKTAWCIALYSCLLLPVLVQSARSGYTNSQERINACARQAIRILNTDGEGVNIQPQVDMQNELNAWLEEHVKGGILEGHTGGETVQQRVYFALAQLPCVQHICEIGFNAGHSTTTWLSAKPQNTLFSMDLGGHDYAYKAMKFYSQKAPGRITWALGSSTESIPNLPWHSRHKCDIVVVDGGHDYATALADIKNMRSLANAHFSILIIDDTPCDAPSCIGPNDAVADMEKQGAIHIVKRFASRKDKGFSVGVYLSTSFGSDYSLPNITQSLKQPARRLLRGLH